jgi:hypothetical protein
LSSALSNVPRASCFFFIFFPFPLSFGNRMFGLRVRAINCGSLSLCLSFSLSLCLSVSLPLCLSVSLSLAWRPRPRSRSYSLAARSLALSLALIRGLRTDQDAWGPCTRHQMRGRLPWHMPSGSALTHTHTHTHTHTLVGSKREDRSLGERPCVSMCVCARGCVRARVRVCAHVLACALCCTSA